MNKILARYVIYTKILQWVNFDFLSFLGKDVNSFLRKFTDNAPYTTEDIDYEALERLKTLGKKYNISIGEIPINSGTVSLVFRGTITCDDKDRQIAIKLLRKNIKSKIESCVNNVEWILSFLKYIPIVNTLDLDMIFTDFKGNLIGQTDFVNEAKNIKMFNDKLCKHQKIKTFKFIEELSFENLIVMEFVEGISIFKLNDIDKRSFAESLSVTIFYSQMRKQLFHLDLHPGNILYTPDKKICYLDLGMMLILEVDECNFILDFLDLLIERNNTVETLRKLLRLHKKCIFRDKSPADSFIDNIIVKNPGIFDKKDNLSIVIDTKTLITELNSSGYKISKRINQILFGFLSFINIFVSLGENMYDITIKNIEKYSGN